jgi:GT2 family glycosyltransferase
MNKKISIVIVTYNSKNLIFECLDSIYRYNDIGDSLEIIIVDNCSKDQDSVFEKIKTDYHNDIILIKSPSNNGYGHGNNQGVKMVSSNHFIVMNPDIRLVEPIFKRILEKFEKNEKIGMMGVTFSDGSNHLYFKPEHTNFIKLVLSRFLIRFGLYNSNEMFFSGSFLIFNKSIFENAGCFDENIFLFHEEADISNRILLAGNEVVLATDISVIHLAHGREVNLFLLKVGSESRHYYFKKYNGNIDKFYSNYLLIYRLKYIVALLLNNKIKKDEFVAWIRMCKNKGKVENIN